MLDPLASLAKQAAKGCTERFFQLNPDIELVITDDPFHVGYLSGYRTILLDGSGYRQALIVSRQRMDLITGSSDAPAALEVIDDPDCIWRYGEFYVSQAEGTSGYNEMPSIQSDFHSALRLALQKTIGKNNQIGLDIVSSDTLSVIKSIVNSDRIYNISDKLKVARATKTIEEQALLRYSSKITDEAISIAREMIKPGVSELEISASINQHIVLKGGITRFAVVTSGERSSRVDAYARDHKIQAGDLVRLDIGATVQGYYSDMARTYSAGLTSELAINRYQSLLEGEQQELSVIKAGVLASDIFQAAMHSVRKGALPGYNRNHCGHGIGLRAHEFPLLGPASDTVIEEGMVLCVETPYYETGWGGMMVEDTVIVTHEGYESLTFSPRELLIKI